MLPAPVRGKLYPMTLESDSSFVRYVRWACGDCFGRISPKVFNPVQTQNDDETLASAHEVTPANVARFQGVPGLENISLPQRAAHVLFRDERQAHGSLPDIPDAGGFAHHPVL